MLELESARVDLARGEAPEHERVVGVGAMSEADQHEAREASTRLARRRYALIQGAEAALSDAIQDYLKEIYKLQAGRRPRHGDGARARREVAPASASAMLKKLAALGLVEHAPYRGVRLTVPARRSRSRSSATTACSSSTSRETLGLHVDDVHDEADRLEHVLSEELEARIDSALGYPTHDPHGDPIPNAELQWPK